MSEVQFITLPESQAAFVIIEKNEQIAEMVVAVSEKNLIVYHTEVSEQHEGEGLGKKLIHSMVDYAKSKNLKVVPLCPYVHAQFKRHREKYSDIWEH